MCLCIWLGMPPMSGMPALDIKERMGRRRCRIKVRDSITEPYTTILNYGLAVKPRERLVTLEWIRDSLTHVLVVKSSLQFYKLSYLPMLLNKHALTLN